MCLDTNTKQARKDEIKGTRKGGGQKVTGAGCQVPKQTICMRSPPKPALIRAIFMLLSGSNLKWPLSSKHW